MTPGVRLVTVPAAGHDGALAVDVHEAADPVGAMIFIHGFASGRGGAKVSRLASDLTPRGWTVLAPDLQGHGDSGGGFEGLTIARSVQDILRVAELPAFRDAPRRALCGSSFGGVVAAWAAVEHPELCERLVLVAPAFGFLERYVAGLADDELRRWRGGAPHVAHTPAGERRLGPEFVREMGPRSWEHLAPRLACPTLIVHGRDDDAVPASATESFVRACPNPALHVTFLGGAGHRLAGHLGALSRLVTDHLGGDLDAMPAAGR